MGRRPGLEVVPGLAAAAAEEGREGEVEAGVDEVADRGVPPHARCAWPCPR